MPVSPPTFCTQADLEQRISVDGVSLRLVDYAAGSAQTTALNDCIEEAGADIIQRCGAIYSNTALLNSDWIRQQAIRIALYYLCIRRANSAPPTVKLRYDKAIEQLDAVRAGTQIINDTWQNGNNAPGLINQRCVLQPESKLVTIMSRSIPHTGKFEIVDPLDD